MKSCLVSKQNTCSDFHSVPNPPIKEMILGIRILYLLILFASVILAKYRLTSFTKRSEMRGQVCMTAKVTFTEFIVNGRARCLHKCLDTDLCIGVFYVGDNKTCVGCKTSYAFDHMSGMQNTGGLSPFVEESTYYELQDCLFRFDGSCYFFTKQMNYTRAAEDCVNLGAVPVQVESATENDFIKTELRKITSDFWFSPEYAYYNGIWDEAEDGVWRFYSSGQKAQFKDWYPGEPGGAARENCAAFYSGNYQFQWVDVKCHTELKMICEKHLE